MNKKALIAVIALMTMIILFGCNGQESSAEIVLDGRAVGLSLLEEPGKSLSDGVGKAKAVVEEMAAERAKAEEEAKAAEKAKAEEEAKAAEKARKQKGQTAESEAPQQEDDSAYLQVSNICQNPELPTGCEVVSATIVLNYYGAGMSKTEIADNYLTYSEDPNQGFCGGTPYEQPDGGNLQWVAAGPIVHCMNQAIAAHGLGLRAVNLTGSDFETLLTYVKNGHPVIFWAWENMASGEHTLVLMGYDRNKGVCYFADPLKSGIQAYNMNKCRNAYNSRGRMAATVQ